MTVDYTFIICIVTDYSNCDYILLCIIILGPMNFLKYYYYNIQVIVL